MEHGSTGRAPVRAGVVLAVALLTLAIGAGVVVLGSALATSSSPSITNVQSFLEQCPTRDVAYAQIRADFEIRREGVPVGALSCTEPISALPIAQYTDELIAAQALRTIYYMEGGRQVPYPWTAASLYDWMKSQIGGVNLKNSGSYCCDLFNGRWYIVLSLQNQWDRDADRSWTGISQWVALAAHETRHVQGFPHVGGCPSFPTSDYGCDQTYDENNLAPYGVEWWLNAKWLSGEINVGYSCPSPYVAQKIGQWHLDAANRFRDRFVEARPPLLTMPEQPGGACPATPTPSVAPTPTPAPCPDDGDCDGWANWREAFLYTNPSLACPLTAQADDEAVDAWPPDLDDNQVVDTTDVGLYQGRLGAAIGSLLYLNRYDMDINGKINTVDVGFLVGRFGTTCA